MWLDLKEEVELELAQIRQQLDEMVNLCSEVTSREPNRIEISALGALLHAFYNGVENIFKRIAIHIDGGPPRGEDWHKQLLESMVNSNPARPAVISSLLRGRLKDYMDFRHFFRHAYGFLLIWNRMSPHVFALEETFNLLKTELDQFIDTIKPEDTA